MTHSHGCRHPPIWFRSVLLIFFWSFTLFSFLLPLFFSLFCTWAGSLQSPSSSHAAPIAASRKEWLCHFCCCHKSCCESAYIAIALSIETIAWSRKELCLMGMWAAWEKEATLHAFTPSLEMGTESALQSWMWHFHDQNMTNPSADACDSMKGFFTFPPAPCSP